MTAAQRLREPGRDGDDSIATHERARPRANHALLSLYPQESGRKAVTIEWLLAWAYARERVHQARLPDMAGATLFAPRGFARAASSERIGAAVGSSMNLGFEAPADAYAVERAVAAQGAAAQMLRDYALMNGARPDWTPRPRIWVEPGRAGNAMHIDARGRRITCPFRLFTYRGDLPAIVQERRRKYGRWARAVAAVHALLAAPGALAAYQLTPDLPPLAPWERGGNLAG